MSWTLPLAIVAIVLVSSDLPELLALSDRVLVLANGRTTACLSREDASPEAVIAAATLAPESVA